MKLNDSAAVRFLVLALLVLGLLGGASADVSLYDYDSSDEGWRDISNTGASVSYDSGENALDLQSKLLDGREGDAITESPVKIDFSKYNEFKVDYKVYDINGVESRVRMYTTTSQGTEKDEFINFQIQESTGSYTFTGDVSGITEDRYVQFESYTSNQFNYGADVYVKNFRAVEPQPPEFDSSSITPDPPLIGETADFSYTANDDGSIQSVELVLKDDGSTVFTGSKSTASGTFSPPDKLTEGDITAEFTATDNAGVSTTEWINRTLSESGPDAPVINSPDSSTKSSLTIDYNIDTFDDGDDNVNQEITVNLIEDGNQVATDTVTEGDTVTGSYSTTVGSHTLNVEVVESDDGQTASSSVSYDVEDSVPPNIRNFQGNATSLPRDEVLNIQAEVRDDETGVYKTLLATNESGQWKNYTTKYDSPQFFSNQSGLWLQTNHNWDDNVFVGDLGVRIYVRDKVGNWKVSETKVFDIQGKDYQGNPSTDTLVDDASDSLNSYVDSQKQDQLAQTENIVDLGAQVVIKDSNTIKTSNKTDLTTTLKFDQVVGTVDKATGGRLISQLAEQNLRVNKNSSYDLEFKELLQKNIQIKESSKTNASLANAIREEIQIIDTANSVINTSKLFISQDTGIDATETSILNYLEGQSQPATVTNENSETIEYLTQSVTQASTTTGIDVVTSYISQPLTQMRVDSENTTIIDYTTQALTSTPVTSLVDPTVQYISSLFSDIESDTSVENNINPTIDNVELIVTGLQDGAEIKANISVSDENGNLDQIQINGETHQVSGFKDYAVFDIADRLEDTYTARVYDTNGKIQQKQVGFNIREKTPVHIGTDDNITLQTARLNDSIENTGNIPLNYSLTHNTFNGTVLQGPTHTGAVKVNETDYFSTDIRGDFLEQEKQWHTDNSVYNTVENQTIVQTLNITSQIPEIEWTDINTTSTSAPAPFQPCDNCGSQTISFTNSYSNLEQWSDTGDGINNQYVQNLADVVIGERDEWWEQYRYNNLTSEVRFQNIWANATIDDTQTDFTQPFVRIEEGNTFNNTFNLEETQACNTKDTGIDSFNLDGQEWRGCATDTDGNGKSDYFRIRIPSFSDFNVRYGLGERPEQQFQYTLGDPCPDSLEGDTFDNETLVCYRNEIISQEDASLDTRDISRELGIGVSGLVIAILIVILLYLVFVDERNFDLGKILNDSDKNSKEGYGYDP